MSLSAIAEEPAYLTNEPIMLIAGVDPTDGRVKQIHASCWPNQRAMREIELVTGVEGEVAAGLPLRDGGTNPSPGSVPEEAADRGLRP